MVKKSSQSRKDLQLFQRLCTFFLTLSNSQNVLQCIKQVLTLDPNFNPFPLFNYLSRNNTSISKKQLQDFMNDNNLPASDQEIRSLLSSYGCKDKLTYTEFLNYVYPYNTQVVREISTVQIKKYVKTERVPVNQEVLCCFVMLLEEELGLIKKLEVQKRDNSLKISREKLKKVFKAIKKVSEKQANHTLNSQNVITHLQLRTFIRSFKKVEDHQFLNLGRRLSMGRQGIVGLDELEFWLKPWKKEKKMQGEDDYGRLLEEREQDQMIGRSAAKPEEAKDNAYDSYKSNLYGELGKSVVEEPEVAIQVTPAPVTTTHSTSTQPFLNYVKTYLKHERNLDHLRASLALKDDVDMMKLFKRFDKSARGVINAQDLQSGFLQLGGQPPTKPFIPLISKYSSQSGILSYSQFTEIFRPSDQSSNKRTKRLVSTSQPGHDSCRLIVSILQSNLQSQTDLLSIPFQLEPTRVLFSLINAQRNGFVSYQELKNYLSSFGINPSMGELMAILKRFDRSKNGVILEGEFVRVLARV